MRLIILLLAFTLVNCSKKSADQAAQSATITGSCQLQSQTPATGYGENAYIAIYYCSQYRPSCFYQMLRGPAFSQVPIVLDTNCPSDPILGQVPPV